MSKKAPSKSAFIRSLPADMSAADVVAKAKDANIKITPSFVYAIRSKSRAKSGVKSAARGRKSSNGKPTASDFIRAQPATMKAADLVAAGAKQGLKFSTNLVYAVRSGPGQRGGVKAAGGAGVEASFRRLALDLGIGRSRQLIDDLERRLRDLIGR